MPPEESANNATYKPNECMHARYAMRCDATCDAMRCDAICDMRCDAMRCDAMQCTNDLARFRGRQQQRIRSMRGADPCQQCKSVMSGIACVFVVTVCNFATLHVLLHVWTRPDRRSKALVLFVLQCNSLETISLKIFSMTNFPGN